MSSSLSAAENAARQRLKRSMCVCVCVFFFLFFFLMGEENTRAVELASGDRSLFISGQKHNFLNLNSPKGTSDLKIIDRFSIASCCIDFFSKHKRLVRKQTDGNQFEFFDFILLKETFWRK